MISSTNFFTLVKHSCFNQFINSWKNECVLTTFLEYIILTGLTCTFSLIFFRRYMLEDKKAMVVQRSYRIHEGTKLGYSYEE